eukprot:SAG31_NODE_1360_length_8638_cov_55.988055_6_plen_171_part_00
MYMVGQMSQAWCSSCFETSHPSCCHIRGWFWFRDFSLAVRTPAPQSWQPGVIIILDLNGLESLLLLSIETKLRTLRGWRKLTTALPSLQRSCVVGKLGGLLAVGECGASYRGFSTLAPAQSILGAAPTTVRYAAWCGDDAAANGAAARVRRPDCQDFALNRAGPRVWSNF